MSNPTVATLSLGAASTIVQIGADRMRRQRGGAATLGLAFAMLACAIDRLSVTATREVEHMLSAVLAHGKAPATQIAGLTDSDIDAMLAGVAS